MTQSQELAETLKPELEHLVPLLSAYVESRAARDTAGQAVEQIGKLFKSYLGEHEGEVLWDGEKLIEAQMKTRRTGRRDWDLESMQKHVPHLFDWLLHHNCLTVKEDALKAAGAFAGGADKYASEWEQAEYLDVRVKA
jgi:hypothetical protein